MVECGRGYFSGARSRFAYGPDDATATRWLLRRQNPDCFYLLGSPGQGAVNWVLLLLFCLP